MRIVAGSAKGRRIQAPKGTNVRPTTDRVREALFSSLTPRLKHAAVLDLFAGTGALGLESLSRGARLAVFVEHNRNTARILLQNIEICKMMPTSTVIIQEAMAALRRLSKQAAVFDLLFLDPPYQGPMLEKCLAYLGTSSLLAQGALIVAEHPEDKPPNLPRDLQIVTTKRYGKTILSFIEGY